MADINDELERTAQHFAELNRVLDPYTEVLNASTTGIEEETKARKKAAKEQYDAIKSATDKTIGFTKQLASSNGSFSTLNPVINLTTQALGGMLSLVPVVGGALKGLAEGAGEAAKLMIDQFQIGWNAYKDLADIGISTSFEDLRETADSLDLKFEDVSRAIKPFAADIANLGGGVAAGLKTFKTTAIALEGTREEFRRLGISAEEFATFQAKYQAQETRLGRARNQDLAAGTKNYIEQLDTLSKLTGLSRKDLQAQRDAALSESRFAAATSLLSKKVQETALDLNTLITSKGGPALAQGFRDLLSGAVTTDAAKALVTQTGGQVQEIVAKVRAGTITSAEAFNQLSKSFDPVKMAHFAQYVGDASLASQNFAEAQKLFNAGKISQKDLDEIKKARDEVVKGDKKQTAALSDTEKNLYNTAKNLQQVATTSTLLTSAMEIMSDAVDALATKLYELSGDDLPEHLKLRKEERDAIKKENSLRKELEHTTKALDEAMDPESSMGLGSKREQLEKDLATASTNRAAIAAKRKALTAPPAAGAGGAAGAPVAGITGTGDYSGLRIKSEESTAGGAANPEAIRVAKEIQEKLGGQLQYFSAFNDRYHKALDSNSKHKTGQALDFVLSDSTKSKEVADMVRGLKGVTFVKDEYLDRSANATGGHIHVEIAEAAQVAARQFGGKVSSGRQYLVGEDGPEVMTAKSDGTITPNSVFDGGFAMLGEKLDRLTDAVHSSISVEKKILQRSMV